MVKIMNQPKKRKITFKHKFFHMKQKKKSKKKITHALNPTTS